MSNSSPMGITYKPLGQLFGMLGSGAIKLKTKQVMVLTALVSQMDPTTNTSWLPQPTHARIAGMSVATLKTTLKSLIPDFIENTGTRELGAAVYRIKFDALTARAVTAAAIAQVEAVQDETKPWERDDFDPNASWKQDAQHNYLARTAQEPAQ